MLASIREHLLRDHNDVVLPDVDLDVGYCNICRGMEMPLLDPDVVNPALYGRTRTKLRSPKGRTTCAAVTAYRWSAPG